MNNIMIRLGLICAVLLATHAASGQCSSKTLQGTYGFIVQGTIGSVPAVETGIITYDGAGKHSGEAWLSIGGGGAPVNSDQLKGVQTVYPDCHFVGKHLDDNGNVLITFEGTITGLDITQELHFVVTDPGFVAYGTDYRVSPKACSLSTLKGAYTFSGQGTITSDTPPSAVAREGIITFNGTGSFSGKVRAATALGIWPPLSDTGDTRDTFSGTYAVQPSCIVSLDVTSSTSSIFGLIHELGTITQGFDEVDVMITDAGFVYAEAMKKQF